MSTTNVPGRPVASTSISSSASATNNLCKNNTPSNDSASLDRPTVKELKAKLHKLKLPLAGPKADMIERLNQNSSQRITAFLPRPLVPLPSATLPPWVNCDAKECIIKDLKNDTSDFHILSMEKIRQRYAPTYNKKICTANIKRLYKSYQEKTGPFKKINNTVEPWKSRKTAKSKAWTLLYKLRMEDPHTSDIGAKTVDQIHESHALFRQYPLNEFKEYNQDMIKLTSDKKNTEMMNKRHLNIII